MSTHWIDPNDGVFMPYNDQNPPPDPAQAIENLRMGPESTVADMAEICRLYSTEEWEVVARIEFFNGQPFVSFHKEKRGYVPNFLRRNDI